MSSSARSSSDTVKTRNIYSPLIGRRGEISMLEDALADTIATHVPHVITVVGSPGVGKSRLVREFLADVRSRDESVAVHMSHCNEDEPPLGVIRRLMRTRFGLLEGGNAASNQALLREHVEKVLGDRRVTDFLHFLGAFLGVDMPDSPITSVVSEEPEQFRQLGRNVLRRFLEFDAEAKPLLIVLEDFQWAHEDSLELIQYLVKTMREVPVLLIIVARPQLITRSPTWMEGQGESIRFDLGPLSHEQAAELVRSLLKPTGNPPEEMVDAAVELAGGSPYLLEQMVRSFFRSGALKNNPRGGWDVDLSKLDAAQLPLSVDDAINARISSLTTTEHNLLEMAATIGGVFAEGALVALTRCEVAPPKYWSKNDDDRLRVRETLEHLIDRDYLLQLPDSTVPGDVEYAFKHNLEREGLQRFTSKNLLRRYHLVIAQWLELKVGDNLDDHAELIAQHYEKGGAPTEAARFFLLAGDHARKRLAVTRAREDYRHGLELLGETDVRLRVETLAKYGDASLLAGSPEGAVEAFEELRALAYKLDLKPRAALAHFQIGRACRQLGQLAPAMRHLDAAMALYETNDDKLGAAGCMEEMGAIHWLRGNYRAGEHVAQEALETRRQLGEETAVARGLNGLAVIFRDSQRYDEAAQAFEQALALRRAIEDQRGIADTLLHLGGVEGLRGNNVRAVQLWNEALAIAQTQGDRASEANLLTCLGSAHYRSGQTKDAVTLLEKAKRIAGNLGDRLLEADTLRSLAKARALHGDLKAAHTDLSRAIQAFYQAESKPHLGVALRTMGEVLAMGDWPDKPDMDAGKMFEQAGRVFEELGNDLELARTFSAHADHLARGETAETPQVAQQVQRLRDRARSLLERRQSVSLTPVRP